MVMILWLMMILILIVIGFTIESSSNVVGQPDYGYVCIACSCFRAPNRGSFTSKGLKNSILAISLLTGDQLKESAKILILINQIQPYGSKKALISRTMMKNILFHAFYQVKCNFQN